MVKRTVSFKKGSKISSSESTGVDESEGVDESHALLNIVPKPQEKGVNFCHGS